MRLIEPLHHLTPVAPLSAGQCYPVVVWAEEDGSYTVIAPDFLPIPTLAT